MALNPLQLINAFMALKKFEMMVRAEKEMSKEARRISSKQPRRARYQSSGPRTAGLPPSPYLAYRGRKAQEAWEWAHAERRKVDELMQRKGYSWMPGAGWVRGAKAGRSTLGKLQYMEKAEEIKNKFPREVLAAQQQARREELEYADRIRRYAVQERMYGDVQGWGSPMPASTSTTPDPYKYASDLLSSMEMTSNLPSIAPLELIDMSQYED